jgi:hypothetical protein
VPPEPGCEERSSSYDLDFLAILVDQACKLLQAFPFLSPSCRLFIAPLAIFGIHPGCEFS